jgi:hypothetical protein
MEKFRFAVQFGRQHYQKTIFSCACHENRMLDVGFQIFWSFRWTMNCLILQCIKRIWSKFERKYSLMNYNPKLWKEIVKIKHTWRVKITFSRGYAVLPQVAHLSCVPENILAALLGVLVWIANFPQQWSLIYLKSANRLKPTQNRLELTSSGPVFSGVIFAAERRKPRAHHSIRSHKRKNLAFFMSMIQYW